MSCECKETDECCKAVAMEPLPWHKMFWLGFKGQLRKKEPSNLELHAEREMRLAGLYDTDSDYGGMLPQAVMALIKAHAKQGHSGSSHVVTMQIFNKLANFQNLKPISSNSDEWNQVSGDTWQSKRRSDAFSRNGGKTWYYLDEPEHPEHSDKNPE